MPSRAVPGAKRTITDEQVEQMIIRTLETRHAGDALDYARDGEAVGLSHMAISRVCDTFNDVVRRANAKTSEVITQFHQRDRSAESRVSRPD